MPSTPTAGPAAARSPVAQQDRRPGRRGHGVVVGVVVLAGLGFVALATVAHRVPILSLDLAITRYVQGLRGAWIAPLLHPFNVLGFPPVVGIAYGTIVVLLFAAGARWEAAATAFATLGAAGLNQVVKGIVDRPRPPMELVHVARQHLPGTSFPAGHVLNFTALALLLCYVTYVRLAPSWPRVALITILVVMMSLMGIARIHAGEHWPSDVLGGYLLGGVWGAAAIAVYRRGLRWRHGDRAMRANS